VAKQVKALLIIASGILALSLLFYFGCSRNFKHYGYSSTESRFPWGSVRGKLIGREARIGNSDIKGSPYKLFLWFGSDNQIDGIIHIEKIDLINSKTQKVVFKNDEIQSEPIKKDSADFTAYFSFNGLELDYEDMELQIKFSLEQDGKSSNYESVIYFKKDYKEFRRPLSV